MRPRWRRVAVGVAVGVMIGLVPYGWIPSPASAQEELVARGNAAYQSGDFEAAVEAYRAVREAGFRSAGLEYNLGNAYFKSGDLGRAILHWERARRLAPADEDVQANLELGRSLTVDAVEPLPRFWLFSLADRWIDLLPRSWLLTLLILGWLSLTGGVVVAILVRSSWSRPTARALVVAGGLLLLTLGPSFLVREAGVGRPDRGVILADAVLVRSAPAADDDLALFEIHEGTRVRVDQRAGEWVEVVLDDGKVGWIPANAMELI